MIARRLGPQRSDDSGSRLELEGRDRPRKSVFHSRGMLLAADSVGGLGGTPVRPAQVSALFIVTPRAVIAVARVSVALWPASSGAHRADRGPISAVS